MFPATFSAACAPSSASPPTSWFGRQASEIPGSSVELFTMPQIHHRGAIEAHCAHPLTVSMAEPYKGASLKRVTGAWAPAIINLEQSGAEPPLRSTNGALIAGPPRWGGGGGGVVWGWGVGAGGGGFLQGGRGGGLYKPLLICFRALRPMSPN